MINFPVIVLFLSIISFLIINNYNRLDDKYIEGTTSWLSSDTSYSIHKVELNDTYDSIALKYYNSPLYYWIILDFNHIQDPFKEPEVGT